MFLTADEVETLTGYRKPSAQIRWLRETKRYRFEINGAGHVVIARAWIEGTPAASAHVVDMPARPNLRALPGRG